MKDSLLFRFAMISDTHIREPPNANILVRGLEYIQSLGDMPSIIFFGGDMTDSGMVDEYRVFLEKVSSLSVPHHFIVGNHDIGNSRSRRKYTRYFGPPNHSFEFKGVRCILLDTNNADPDPEDWHGRAEEPALNWLERELGMLDRKTPVLLFTHQGLVGKREELECDVENAQEVLGLLSYHNLLAGFAAHAHRFHQRRRGDIDFIVCPALSTCKGNADGEPPGFLLVDVYRNRTLTSLLTLPQNLQTETAPVTIRGP